MADKTINMEPTSRSVFLTRNGIVLAAVVILSHVLTVAWMSTETSTNYLLYDAALQNYDSMGKPWTSVENCSLDVVKTRTPQHSDYHHHEKNLIRVDGVDKNATCDDLMEHFHQVIAAFHNNPNSINASTTAPPLINYGFYKGQGFGRLIEHSVSHCLLSLALDRPCLVDLTDRDPFYTWRAFLNTGTYDWQIEDKGSLESLLRGVHGAIRALPQQEAGAWEAPHVPHTKSLHLMEKLDWPPGRTDRRRYWKHIEPWRDIPKALLSPNWGSAWFPSLTPPARFGTCHRKELITRIQNSMYQPTPLTKKLFAMRRREVFPDNFDRPFGAIHLRFVILQIQKMLPKEDIDDTQVLKGLTKCIQYAYQKTNLTDWWLISDKPARAISVADRLVEQSDHLFHIYYHEGISNATTVTDHSNNIRARGLFGHASMAVSVLDWMVLHESEAAIVTFGTSYGDTGARGRGKVNREDLFGIFNLYMP